jgi:hypothetical protein
MGHEHPAMILKNEFEPLPIFAGGQPAAAALS